LERYDWDALNRLHEKEFIGDPVGKAKSVFVTEEGAERSQESSHQFFGKWYDPPARDQNEMEFERRAVWHKRH